MPFFQCPMARAALTANGGTDGYATVADATPFYPGAHVWLRSALVASKEYIVTDIAAGNKIGLREVLPEYGGQTYGRTPLGQWLLADTASIDQESQVVRVEFNNYQKVTA
jgi:hypothetical protein